MTTYKQIMIEYIKQIHKANGDCNIYIVSPEKNLIVEIREDKTPPYKGKNVTQTIIDDWKYINNNQEWLW